MSQSRHRACRRLPSAAIHANFPDAATKFSMYLKTVIDILGFIAQECKRIWHKKHLVATALQAVGCMRTVNRPQRYDRTARRLRPPKTFLLHVQARQCRLSTLHEQRWVGSTMDRHVGVFCPVTLPPFIAPQLTATPRRVCNCPALLIDHGILARRLSTASGRTSSWI